MLRTALLLIFALAFLSSPALAFNMSNTSYKITDAVISSGGGISANTSYKLDMTLGQPVAGYSSNTSYKIYLGRVWQFISSIITPPMESGVSIDNTDVSVTVGGTSRIYITVSNGGSKSTVFPLHIGSFDQSKNWAWFTDHRTDDNRRDVNITIGPYEKRTVSIDFLGAMPGKYKLVIGPDADYANRYGEVPISVVYKSKGLFSTTPDIGAAAFSLVVLAAAIIAASSGRNSRTVVK